MVLLISKKYKKEHTIIDSILEIIMKNTQKIYIFMAWFLLIKLLYGYILNKKIICIGY